MAKVYISATIKTDWDDEVASHLYIHVITKSEIIDDFCKEYMEMLINFLDERDLGGYGNVEETVYENEFSEDLLRKGYVRKRIVIHGRGAGGKMSYHTMPGSDSTEHMSFTNGVLDFFSTSLKLPHSRWKLISKIPVGESTDNVPEYGDGSTGLDWYGYTTKIGKSYYNYSDDDDVSWIKATSVEDAKKQYKELIFDNFDNEKIVYELVRMVRKSNRLKRKQPGLRF